MDEDNLFPEKKQPRNSLALDVAKAGPRYQPAGFVRNEPTSRTSGFVERARRAPTNETPQDIDIIGTVRTDKGLERKSVIADPKPLGFVNTAIDTALGGSLLSDTRKIKANRRIKNNQQVFDRMMADADRGISQIETRKTQLADFPLESLTFGAGTSHTKNLLNKQKEYIQKVSTGEMEAEGVYGAIKDLLSEDVNRNIEDSAVKKIETGKPLNSGEIAVLNMRKLESIVSPFKESLAYKITENVGGSTARMAEIGVATAAVTAAAPALATGGISAALGIATGVTAISPSTRINVLDRYYDKIFYDFANDETFTEKGKPLGEAVLRGVGSSFFENLIEGTGGGIAFMATRMGKKEAGITLTEAVLSAINKGKFDKKAFSSAVLKSGQFHGIPGEIWEEELQAGIDSFIDETKYNSPFTEEGFDRMIMSGIVAGAQQAGAITVSNAIDLSKLHKLKYDPATAGTFGGGFSLEKRGTPQDSPLHTEAKKFKSAEEFIASKQYDSSGNKLDELEDMTIEDSYAKEYRYSDEIQESINGLEQNMRESYDPDIYDTKEEADEDIQRDIDELVGLKHKLAEQESKIKQEAITEWLDNNKNWLGDSSRDVELAINENHKTGGTAWEALLQSPNEEQALDMLNRMDVASKRHGDTEYDSFSKKGMTDEQVAEFRREFNQDIQAGGFSPLSNKQHTDIWNEAQINEKTVQVEEKQPETQIITTDKLKEAPKKEKAKKRTVQDIQDESSLMEEYSERLGISKEKIALTFAQLKSDKKVTLNEYAKLLKQKEAQLESEAKQKAEKEAELDVVEYSIEGSDRLAEMAKSPVDLARAAGMKGKGKLNAIEYLQNLSDVTSSPQIEAYFDEQTRLLDEGVEASTSELFEVFQEKLQKEHTRLSEAKKTQRAVFTPIMTEKRKAELKKAGKEQQILEEELIDAQRKAEFKEKRSKEKEAKLRERPTIEKGIKDKIKEFKKGYKKGSKETARDLRILQRELAKYARATLSTDRLMKSELNKILNAPVKVVSVEKLEEAFNTIQEISQKTQKKSLIAKINKELAKEGAKKTKAGIIKGKYLNADFQEKIDALPLFINEVSRADAMEKIDELLEKDELSYEEKVQISLLSLVDLEAQTVTELTQTLKEVRQIKAEGRTIRQQKLDEQKAYDDDRARRSVNDLLGGDKKNVLIVGAKKKERTRKQKANDFDSENLGLVALVEKLSRKVKTKKVKIERIQEDTLHQEISLPVLIARQNQNKGELDALDSVQASFAEIYEVEIGKKDARKAWKRQDEKILIHESGYENKAGEIVDEKLELTRQELIGVYMQSKDALLKQSLLEGNKFKPGTLMKMYDALSIQDKAWAVAQLDYYRNLYDRVNAVYREIHGVNLGFSEFYSPIQRVFNQNETEQDMLKNQAKAYRSMTVGALKHRTENLLPLKIRGANDVLFDHIGQMEHYIAFAQPIAGIKRLLRRDEVRSALVQNQYNSDNILNHLDTFIDDIASDGATSAFKMERLDRIRVNFVKYAVGANPMVYLKQLTSLPAWLADTKITEWVSGLVRSFIPKILNKRKAELLDSTALRIRHLSGHERDIKLGSNQNKSVVKGLGDNLMFLVKSGDETAITKGGLGFYQERHRKHIKEGLSENDAQERAIMEFEIIMNMAQQSADIEAQNSFQRGGSAMKAATVLHSAINLYYREFTMGIRNIANGRGNLTQNIKQVAIYGPILASIFQYVASGFKWEEDKQLRAIAAGPLAGIFIVGDLARTLIEWSTGGDMFDASISPLSSIFSGMKKAFMSNKKILKQYLAEEDIKPEDIIYAATSFLDVGGMAAGLPTRSVSNVALGAYDLATGATDNPLRLIQGKYAAGELPFQKKEEFKKELRKNGVTDKAREMYDKLLEDGVYKQSFDDTLKMQRKKGEIKESDSSKDLLRNQFRARFKSADQAGKGRMISLLKSKGKKKDEIANFLGIY